MTDKINTLLAAIDTLLSDVNDGATPTHNHYLPHVWVGTPARIPQGAQHVAIITPLTEPTFYYSMGNSCPVQSDLEVEIVIITKGHVEDSTTTNITVTQAVKAAIIANDTFSGACVGTTIELIEYGSVGVGDMKNLATASKIIIKCLL